MVFLDHMIGWPTGGFVGVDMFFVISGFLITGLLLREYDKSGHISAKKFYISRAKRIVPAATLVLVVTVWLSFLAFSGQRAWSIAWDAVASFFFFANWNFALEGTDYFQQGSAVSPLQHYWSLSVEEQFYFVWPWLLLGLLVVFAGFGKKSSARTRAIAGTTIAAISVASFGWALVQSVSSPTLAYFSTVTRTWELGIGALLAVAAPIFSRLAGAARVVMAYVGLSAMIAACFVITPETVWPAPWALLPTLATTLVIASGVGAESRFLWPLTNPVSVYIGNISYSLYLWHFPVIVFGIALFPSAGEAVYFGIAIVGFGLAIAAYHTVERPLWKSPLWVSRGHRAWKAWRSENAREAGLGLLAGASVVTAALVALALTPLLTPRPAIAYEPKDYFADASASEPSTQADALTAEIVAASRATTWPSLTPSIDEIGSNSKVDAWVQDGCLAGERGAEADFTSVAARCVYGDANAPKTAVLVGDSVAISWLPALEDALTNEGWKIHVLTMQQCGFANISLTTSDGSAHPKCDEYHSWVPTEIARLNPQLVVASQTDSTAARVAEGGQAQLQAAVASTLKSFASTERSVVVLPALPRTVALGDCYTAAGSPANCNRPVPEEHRSATSLLSRAAGGATLVQTDSLFCASGTCPIQVAGFVVRADVTHATEAYMRFIAPSVRAILEESVPQLN
ncbi:O-acetyltransferase OatA [Microbacterium trichothecenolyticum]|uniref:O-acetyltransferase OatA n=1 Tax=Microbacterium trichothecenolyticum TaxID=69370 RepID=A0A0M2H3K5_MICTR|nr:O-acetyltransferase OatA [Microbacterium trichothecenolyticum]